MVSLRCTECDINWYIYQAVKGACPVCGSGTKRVLDPASPEAQDRYEQHRKGQVYKSFETFYAKREQRSKDGYTVTGEAEALLRRLANEDP